jgi:hypothetical protein
VSKLCSKCGGSGPFSRDKKSKDGFSTRCKKCAAQYTRLWSKANAANPKELDSNKTCYKCGGKGPFYRQKGSKDGFTTKCIECFKKDPSRQPERRREIAVAYRKKNSEKFKLKDAIERVKYAERRKGNWDSWAYGLKPGDRQKLIESQGGKCAICQEELQPSRADIDHNHKTSKVRGVLCRLCNNLLGDFKENSQYLISAMNYLTATKVILPSIEVQVCAKQEGAVSRKGYYRGYHLRKKYGITLAQFEWLLEKQGHKCCICFKLLPSSGHSCHVDHDHKLGTVRGVLCNCCNVGLGRARENPQILKNAIYYLSRSEVNL